MVSAASQQGQNLGAVVIWMAVLIAAALLLAVVVVMLRRWLKRGDRPDGAAWTLDQLMAMRDSGDLSIEQYERLRSELFK